MDRQKVMDCQQVRERLPWLVNSSLDPQERALVEQHLESCDRCRGELADTRAAFSIFGQHLPATALVDHAFDRTTPGLSRQRVDRHLGECPACRAEHALIRESRACLDEAAAADRLPRQRSSGWSGAHWQRLAAAAGIIAAISAGGWVWSWQRIQQQETTIAAVRQRLNQARSAGRADGGLAVRISELEQSTTEMAARNQSLADRLDEAQALAGQLAQRIESLSLPQLNVPIIDLFPTALSLRGDPLAGEPPLVPRSNGMAILVLSTQLRSSDPVLQNQGLQVELRDASNRVQWRQSGLRLSANRDFSVHLPTSSLAAGEYQLLVHNAGGEQQGQPLETYRFRVGPLPTPPTRQ